MTTRAVAATATDVMEGIAIIDADTHLTEPHDLWTSRAPGEWADRVPQVREVKGRSMWTIDGEVFGNAVGAAVILPDGSKTFGTGFMALGIDDVHAGASAVAPRLAVMDEQGIYAQIVYPNVVGFGGQRFVDVVDPTLKSLCATIYNDAMAEIQDGVRRPHVPDGDPAVVGHRRRGGRGGAGARARAAGHQHQRRPAEPGVPRPRRTGTGIHSGRRAPTSRMPVNFHIGGERDVDELARQHAVALVRRRAQARARLARRDDLATSGPSGTCCCPGCSSGTRRCRSCRSRAGSGGSRSCSKALDYEIGECAPHISEHLSMQPSEYFRRQVHACYWFERDNLQGAIDALGSDNILFETDFPHPTCLYPDSLASRRRTAAVRSSPRCGARS